MKRHFFLLLAAFSALIFTDRAFGAARTLAGLTEEARSFSGSLVEGGAVTVANVLNFTAPDDVGLSVYEHDGSGSWVIGVPYEWYRSSSSPDHPFTTFSFSSTWRNSTATKLKITCERIYLNGLSGGTWTVTVAAGSSTSLLVSGDSGMGSGYEVWKDIPISSVPEYAPPTLAYSGPPDVTVGTTVTYTGSYTVGGSCTPSSLALSLDGVAQAGTASFNSGTWSFVSGSAVTTEGTKTVSVTFTQSDNQTATATGTLTVRPHETLSQSVTLSANYQSSVVVNAGDSVLLHVEGGQTGYSWTTTPSLTGFSGPTAPLIQDYPYTFTSPGTYTVTVVAPAGTVGTLAYNASSPASVTVRVNALPSGNFEQLGSAYAPTNSLTIPRGTASVALGGWAGDAESASWSIAVRLKQGASVMNTLGTTKGGAVGYMANAYTWTASLNTSSLAAGSYTLEAIVTDSDSAAVTLSNSKTLVVETIPAPTVSYGSPSQAVVGRIVTYTGGYTVGGATTPSTLALSVDGAVQTGSVSFNAGTWTFVSSGALSASLGAKTVSVTFTQSDGQSATATGALAVIAAVDPSATISASPATLMLGESPASTTISATFSPGTYTFSGSAINGPTGATVDGADAVASRSYTFTPTATGTYSFSAWINTDKEGWKSINSLTVIVSPVPPPTVTLSPSGYNGTVGQALTFTGTYTVGGSKTPKSLTVSIDGVAQSGSVSFNSGAWSFACASLAGTPGAGRTVSVVFAQSDDQTASAEGTMTLGPIATTTILSLEPLVSNFTVSDVASPAYGRTYKRLWLAGSTWTAYLGRPGLRFRAIGHAAHAVQLFELQAQEPNSSAWIILASGTPQANGAGVDVEQEFNVRLDDPTPGFPFVPLSYSQGTPKQGSWRFRARLQDSDGTWSNWTAEIAVEAILPITTVSETLRTLPPAGPEGNWYTASNPRTFPLKVWIP